MRDICAENVTQSFGVMDARRRIAGSAILISSVTSRDVRTVIVLTDGDYEKNWTVNECSTCETALCPEHILSEISSRRAGDCEQCDERVISLLQEKNTRSLSSVHALEKALGFEERFDAEESHDILQLLSDKEKLEMRQDHLAKRVLSSGSGEVV